jgi:hypothetical protein
MSPTTPPRSPSPSVEPDEVQSPLSPAQPESKTPEHRCGASCPTPDVTPLSHASSVCQSQEGSADSVEEFDWSDHDSYIREDLGNRVFVDSEVFMKHVLRVPDDWRAAWGPAIEAVKADLDFKRHHEEYCNRCDKFGSQKTFYGPLTKTANAVLEVLSLPISPKISNLVAPRKDRQTSEEGCHWTNPLHILKVKSYNNALCDGATIPRLVTDGEHAARSFRVWIQLIWGTGVDPTSNHASPHEPSRHSANNFTPHTTSTTASGSTSGSSKSRKRPADGSSTADQPARKKLRTKSTSGRIADGNVSDQVREEDEDSSTPEPETQDQVDSAIQVCCHLIEMFSASPLRSHATVSLVDRNCIQLYHANRSVILISSAINFSEGDGLSKFIAIIIAFNRLSFEQNGTLDTFSKKNTELVKGSGIPADKVAQRGNQLEFLGDKPEERFTVDLGDTISRDPAIIGKSTVVLEATSDRWPGVELVVKISWPDSERARETDLLKKANDEAEKTAGKWATKHLPRVFYAMDIVFYENSAIESVARLFRDAEVTHRKFVYERRTLRVIVQERLYPLKSLTNVRDIGQVILDVACGVYHFRFSITLHLLHFSSLLALRLPRDPSS